MKNIIKGCSGALKGFQAYSRMTIVAMNPVSSSWVFNLDGDAHPCCCCDAPRAMDHMDGYWHCDQQNRTWVVLDESFDAGSDHSFEHCLGSCSMHILMDSIVFSMFHAEAFGLCWGDLILADEEAKLAAETPEQRALRLDAEAAKRTEIFLATRSTEMERYARLKAQTNTEMIKTDRGKVARIRKVQEPCKWLYLDEKAPKCDWRRTREGKPEPPYRPYLTGGECWAFEYHDPKTGKLQIKHTCDRLHPGEEDWRKEWNTNGGVLDKYGRWRPVAAETRDFSSLANNCGVHTPSRCSDTASTVSAVSSHSHHSVSSTSRKSWTTHSYGGKKSASGFLALSFDDSD